MPYDETDADDPLECMGVALPGDTTEAMAETFVEEFLLMGHDEAHILELFRDRFYMAPNMVLREKGEPWVRDLIRRVRDGGVPSVPVRIVEAPAPPPEYPPLTCGNPFEV